MLGTKFSLKIKSDSEVALIVFARGDLFRYGFLRRILKRSSVDSTLVIGDFRQHFRKISRESAIFFSGTVLTSFASYFFKIYLAHTIGAEALGLYALGMTVVGFAGVLGAVGLPQAASKFVAAYKATEDHLKLIQFISFGVCALLITNLITGIGVLRARQWISGTLYHAPALDPLMHTFILIMLLGAFTTFLGQCLAGYKDVAKRTIITNFLGTPATMVLSVLFISYGNGLQGYLAAQVLSASLVLFLLLKAVWNLTPSRGLLFRVRPAADGQVASFSLTLFGNQGLEVLATQTDKVILGIFLTARDLGVYSVATALVAFVPIILQSTNQVFAPTIAELHAKHENVLLLRLYQVLTKWIVALTLPFGLVIIVFSVPLMRLFGSDFAGGWPVLAIMTLGQLVNCAVGSVGQLLLMAGQQQRMLRAQLIVVAITIPLELWLIPRHGFIGAAVVVAGANILLNLLMLRDVIHILGLSPAWKNYTRLTPATIVTIAGVGLLRLGLGPHINIALVFFALLVAYALFAACLAFTGLEDREKLVLKNAWHAVRRAPVNTVRGFVLAEGPKIHA